VSFTGPISTISLQIRAMKRPSDVPPSRESAGVTPVVARIASPAA